MYRLKTGAMISGAGGAGLRGRRICPPTCEPRRSEFADQLGLAFQIRDDMLDVVGDEQVFGKPIGSDKEEGKITYVDVLTAWRAAPGRWKPAPGGPRTPWPSGRTMISCSPWRTSWWTGTSEKRQIKTRGAR